MRLKYLTSQEVECPETSVYEWSSFVEELTDPPAFVVAFVLGIVGSFIFFLFSAVICGFVNGINSAMPNWVGWASLLGGLIGPCFIIGGKLCSWYVNSGRHVRRCFRRKYAQQLYIIDQINKHIEMLDTIGAVKDIDTLVDAKYTLLKAVDAAQEHKEEVCRNVEEECSRQTARALSPLTEDLISQTTAMAKAL